MEWFYYGCEFVNSAVKVWLTLQIFAWLFEPKWELREERGIQAATIVLLAALNTYNNSLGPGLFSNNMLAILACAIGLLGTVLYAASLWYTVSISMTIWLAVALLDFFLLSLIYAFLIGIGMQSDIFVDASVYRGLYLLLFAVAVGWISRKSQGWIRRNAAEWKRAWKRHWGWLCVFLLLLAVCMVYFQRVYKSLVTEHFLLRWILFILAVVFSGMAFKLYRIRQKEKERNRLLQLRLELLEKNYQELWLMQKEKEVLLHDVKNHLNAVRELLGKEKFREAAQYIDRICGEFFKGNNLVWTNQPMLDLVLNSKIREAEQDGIHMDIICDEMPHLILSEFDICALFANLLDNAIEANRKCPMEEDRWIRLSLKKQKCMLAIVMSNPSDEEINSEDGLPDTTKEDKIRHGLGLYSVKRILDTYDGHMKFYTQEGAFRMVIDLVGFED